MATFDPKAIAGLQLWLKADDLALADGAAVTSWPDASSNARTAAQTDATRQPKFRAGALNGKPVVTFDADFLAVSGMDSPAFVTVFAVARLANTTTAARHILSHPAGTTWTSPFARYRLLQESTEFSFDAGTTGTSNAARKAPLDTVPHIFSGAYDGTFVSLKTDGVLAQAKDSSVSGAIPATTQPLTIGARSSTAPGEYWLGDIAELLVFDSQLSTADRFAVERYLGAKWELDPRNPPATEITSGPADGETVRTASQTFAFASDPAGADFEISIDGGAWALAASPFTATFGEGWHTLQARAVDFVGTDATPASRTFAVDTSPPPPAAPPLPSARPALSPVGERLYEQLEPLAYADHLHNFALARLTGAVARMVDETHAYAHAADTPWGRLLDADQAPDEALDWLGQLAGVRLPGNLTPDARRVRVRETDGRRRGTVNAIVGAARQHLTGSRRVEIRERDGGNAYRLRVITFTAETPDPAKVRAALLEQKPAGLVLTYEVRDGQSYGQAQTRHATYGAARLAYPTYGAARDSLPS